MKTLPPVPLFKLSKRVYCALLYLYPGAFRRKYGVQMIQVFRDIGADCYREQGVIGIALWWGTTLFDLILTVIEEHRKVRFTMFKSALAQLAGALLIVGGACCVVAASSQLQPLPPGVQAQYYGIYKLAMLLMAPAYVLIGLGAIGVALRYIDRLSMTSRTGLFAGGIGAMLMAVGRVINTTTDSDSFWFVVALGLLLHAGGVATFGFRHIFKPILPVIRWLPFLIGLLSLPMMITAFQGTEGVGSGANLPSFAYMAVIGVLWLAVGLAIQRQSVSITAQTA